ncbi:MAG: AAA family ATPase [Pirellulaceae bacterium]
MSKPIVKIQMAGFRGAIGPFELAFDPTKDFTMLFGENGSGKSSILDAIDVVCSGTNGCLDGISVGQTPGKYLCSLGCRPATVNVTIHSVGESWTGTMRRNAISVAGTNAKPMVKILRRNRILELVLAQPSDRYKALRHFIDIAIVEQSEGTLQQRLNDIGRTIAEHVRENDRMSTHLHNLWEAEGRPGPSDNAMAWAQSKVHTGLAGLSERVTRLKAVVDAVSLATTEKSNLDTQSAEHATIKEQWEDVNRRIAAAPSVSSTTAVQLLESLEKAKTYIEAEQSLDKCPTCLRPIARDELFATVTKGVKELSDLKTLCDERSQIQKRLDVAAANLEKTQKRLVAALQKVQEVTQAGDIPEIATLNIVWPAWEAATPDMTALAGICGHLSSIQGPLQNQHDNAQRDVNQFNSIKELYEGIKETKDKMTDLDRIRNGLQTAYDIVHEKRVAFTQGILDGISHEANRLFQAIHPGENIGLEHLTMEEERRGSVSQTGVFHGHTDIPPQAIFSESHLDTLGFCVWLALAKRESPNQTIVLIDDIFSSVDATHLARVIDLLGVESQNFLQVIVSTHYRLWWDRCQNAQGIQRIHLGQWCATSGIAAQNMPLVSQQLQQLIAMPVLDRQAVSSKAGILLESVLNDLTLLFECPIPRNKANLYTLGTLLNGCSKLFTRHNLSVQLNTNWNVDGQAEDWQATAVRNAFDRVNALQFIRNQVGCHFNAPGMDIPDQDVRGFGQATLELVAAITCPNCGALATKKSTDGTHLRCSCPKKAARMTPVAIQ